VLILGFSDYKGFGTLTKTVGFALSIPVFFTLINSFIAHLKIKLSQKYAMRRIKQMEQQAAEEDEVNDLKGEPGKNRRRNVKWDTESTEIIYNWY
jgi:uncharacterized membrane protein YciS (DUF1049 family)